MTTSGLSLNKTTLFVKQIPTQALFIGQKVIWLPQCQSTNAEAMSLLKAGDVTEGLLVGTDEQLAGRGQRGNTWQSEPGHNLTVSIILKPTFLAVSQQFQLSMAVALGVRATVAHFTGHQAVVKWPNDVYVGKRKIAGILLESQVSNNKLAAVVAGIGLNVNQLEGMPPQAGSLMMLTGQVFDLREVLAILCQRIEQYYLILRQAGGGDKVKTHYMNHLMGFEELRNYRVTLTGEHFMARITDVLTNGKLVMHDQDGNRRLYDLKEVDWIF